MRWPHGLAVFALCVVVHASAVGGVFHYDDDHAVVDNPHLRSLARVPAYFIDAGTFSVDASRGMYRPLLLASYAAGYAIHGTSAAGFLLVNLLIHAVNAVLVAWLGGRLAGCRRAGPWAGLLAGALFALHPIATEPVHYVSARSDSLVALFILGTLALWLATPAGGGWRRPASWLALAAALWTKSTAIVLPALLLLLDLLRRPHSAGELARRHAPLWAVSVLYLLCSWSTGFLGRSLAAPTRSLEEQLLTQVKAATYYLRLLVWPAGQSVEPAFRVADTVSGPVVAAGLLAAGLLGVAVSLWLGQRRWLLLFLVGWVALALVPTSLAPLNVLVNERRAYLPLAAFAIGLATLAAQVWDSRRQSWPPVAVAALICFGVLSYQRSAAWATELSLWEDAVRQGPQMPRAQLYLGDAHREAGQMTDGRSRSLHTLAARQAYERVVALEPRQRLLALQAENGLAILALAAGDLAGAEGRLQRILAEHPDFVDGLVNLGNVHYARARQTRGADRASLGHAIEHYERALVRAPGRMAAHLNLGAALHLAGDLEAAQVAYESAARLAPEDGTIALNLGNLYLQRARLAEGGGQGVWLAHARSQFERALQQLSSSEVARRGLAAVGEAERAARGRR